MRTVRYFTRVLHAFSRYREGHEVALDAEEFETVRGRGFVAVTHKEIDGKLLPVDVDEGASATPFPTAAPETFPLDTLTDDEREALIAHRRRRDADKAKAEAKAAADAEKAAAAEAKRIADEEAKAKKKADDEAKAAAKAAADADKAKA